MSYAPVKRGVDVIGAVGVGVLLSPLLALIAVVIIVALGRPIFFRQVRAGRDGRDHREPVPGQQPRQAVAQQGVVLG
jgi:lipopolysaccharide/colanic/teichoic acid biosynthesis glycosyltransferase